MPPKNSQHVEHSNHVKPGTKWPRSDHQPTSSGMLLKRPLPRASVEKAAKIFENFSLSKFPKDSLPSNYIHPYKRDVSLHHAERIRHVQHVQRKKIKKHLNNLKKKAEQHPHEGDRAIAVKGITVALPKASMKEIIPSYNEEKRTVDLAEVMELISKHTRGSEFHAKGDPTLNRLAFLARIKKMKQRLGLDRPGEPKGEKK